MPATLVLKPLGLTLALIAAGLGSSLAQSVSSLPTITVSGEPDNSPLQPSIATEQARLNNVPGGTNLIEPQNESRLATLNDALNYQPGLVVQEFFGGLDQPRLNIRGSGIQSNPVNRGVLLLQDDLPLNEADGSFIIGFLEPRNSSLISTRRGANAWSAAATTLGGEMDFQSLTGTASDVLRLEGGSFGRLGLQAAKGFQSDNLDGRLSVTHDKYDGYRHHSGSERTNLQGNFGVQGDSFENRTYLSYVDLDVTIPTVVSRSMMEQDPRQVQGDATPPGPVNVYKRNPHRTSKQFRLANRTYWGSEALNQTFGVYTQNIDDTFQDPQVATISDGMTYGAQWQLAGKLNALDYRFALDWARTDMDRDFYSVNIDNGRHQKHFGNYDLQAENRNALLGLAWHLAPQWTLAGDLKFSQAIRNAREHMTGDTLNQDWSYASPKIGLIWQPVATQRFFANISRSNEAPTYWEIVYGGVKSPMNPNLTETKLNTLDVQRATTFEIGGDGILGTGRYAANWSLTYYRSEVSDELMAVSNAFGGGGDVFNYDGGTRHQGIELGLNGTLPAPGTGAFEYRMAYTFSDFRFKGGEYAGNRIAGVPRDLVSAELLYRIGGLRFGPNVRWMPSATETNHANIAGTQQDAYAILGFKLDYQHDKHWNAYIQADNLSDETYASAFVIRKAATAGAPTFLPGNGRSITAGISYKF
ncbi:TonB-dependent receptor [Alcaligenaceae bacterium CGII-47]|nr:TonB-dependent receptor [Alcaligenaceae bacterium CGII-47]